MRFHSFTMCLHSFTTRLHSFISRFHSFPPIYYSFALFYSFSTYKARHLIPFTAELTTKRKSYNVLYCGSQNTSKDVASKLTHLRHLYS